MPAIRGQSVSGDQQHAVLTLETSGYGTIVVTASRQGANVTLTASRDGSQYASGSVSGLVAVQDWIQSAVEQVTGEAVRLRAKVMSVNPMEVLIGVFAPGVTIPAQWWR